MDKVAIIGLDWAGGPGEGLETLARMAYGGATVAKAGEGYRAPELAERLLRRAGGERRGVRIGVIACGFDGAAGSAQALVTRFHGASEEHLALGLERPDPISALEVGQAWLRQRLVDLVVVACEDTLGSGALLLARSASVPTERIYVLIESIAVGKAEEGPEVCRRGLAAAHVGSEKVGFLDVGSWPPSAAVVAGYQTRGVGTRPSEQPGEALTCAVGAVAALTGGASPMGALINAALCVHRRQWVPTPAGGLDYPQLAWRGTPFHTVTDARPWFLGPECDKRRAAVFCADEAGMSHVVLAEAAPRREHQPLRLCLDRATRTLIPVPGATKDQLLSRLQVLRRLLEEGEPLHKVVRQAHTDFERERAAAFAVAIVGRDREGMLQELQYAFDGVAAAFEKGRDWLTPAGSAFTATPLGDQGVAFVYPGALNSYVGLGRDLFQHFPDLHEQLATRVSDAGRAVAEDRLYPRSRTRLSEDDLKAYASALVLDPPSLIESGAIFAVAHTMVMRDVFGVHPQAALGYSLGETSMLWAAGVWQDGDAGGKALRKTPLFRTRIFGPKDAVREHWGLGLDETVSWTSYLLKARVDDVQRQLQGVPRVYLTLVNQPDEVVIAGDADGCQRVIEALACHALPIPYDVVIHCEPVQSELKAFADLYTYPVVDCPEGYRQSATRFYSAADYDRLRLDSADLADAMARMTCAPVDFPRLVERVYADGARVFVELGPLGTCTRRIKRILRGKPHAAVALNPGPENDFDGVVGALALLLTHRVPLDLSPLYDDEDPMAQPLELGDLVAWDEGEWAQRDRSQNSVEAEFRLDAHIRTLIPHRMQVARMHLAFLDQRSEAQTRAGALIGLQVGVGRAGYPEADGPAPAYQRRTAVAAPAFDEDALREFAVGDVERCFGPDFAVYRGRRLPRIPNGDLMMMSRIVSIDGRPATFTGGPSLVCEYDVPEDAWYYKDAPYALGTTRRGLPPMAVLMETGLQPCGFLSAYLRSPLLEPEADLYFRNLDGHGRVLVDLDLRGRTVSNEVVLKSSVRGPGAILQSYAFALSCQGQRFYEGEGTFGYFRRDGLSRQIGLDAAPTGTDGPRLRASERGHQSRSEPDGLGVRIPARPGAAARRLDLLQDLVATRGAGASVLEGTGDRGTVKGSGAISPADWFFAAHFHQDAVMPGSLGVEAAVQALVAYGRWRWPHFAGVAQHLADHTTTWRYRGQITPDDSRFTVDVHLTEVREGHTGVTVVADASVWRGLIGDGVRIYEVSGLATRLGTP